MALSFNASTPTNRQLIRAASAAGWSLALALLLSNRWLTPIAIMGDALNPWAKWMVAGAQLVVLLLYCVACTYRLASVLAIGFGFANLVALSMNGVSALMFLGWDSSSMVQGGLLLAFLVAQAVAIVTSLRVLRQMKESGPPSYSALAVVIVLIWCAVTWYLGDIARNIA